MKLEEAKGDWALVTGASSGIGYEFCQQLASNGMNLVMVARRKERMVTLAQELLMKYKTRAQILAIDLSVRNSAAQVKAAVEKNGIRIRLLCNNAAFGPWGRFEAISPEVYEGIVQLIAATPISLCHLFLPDLVSFPSSVIINVSSPAALQPVPYKAVYSAAKTCLHNFSLALYGEWQGKGIYVQTLMPGPTKSELDTKGGAYKSALSEKRQHPSEVVALSIACLRGHRPLVTNAKGTYKQRIFASLFPAKVVINVVSRMFHPPEESGTYGR